MDVSPQSFREVMGAFATGVTVVTTQDREGKPYGVTVNSFTSVSLEPPLVLVCLDNRLSGLNAFLESRHFAVNILANHQERESNHFASRGTDRASRIEAVGETGVPLLEDSLASLECRLVDTKEAGDHTILIGEVVALHPPQADHEPLLYYRGGYRRLNRPDSESGNKP